MKKICLVMTDAISFNILCRDQLEYLRDNYDVKITLIAGGGVEQQDLLRKRSIGRVVNIPFKRRPHITSDIINLVRLFLFFAFNRFDVVVYSTPKAVFLGSIASFFAFQRRRLLLMHGRAYENYEGIKRKIFVLMDKLAISLSTFTLAVSASLKEACVQDGVPEDSILVLGQGSSNGVDVERFRPNLGVKKDDKIFRVGVVGRVCFDKGVCELDKVIRTLKKERPSVVFNVYGRVEDAHGEEVLNGWLRDELVVYSENKPDIEKAFQDMDLHLFLTHREGFGNVALEAAACSVPTFAFDVVGVRDSVRDKVSGALFALGDTKAVIDAVVEAVDNPEAYNKRYSTCREWAKNNFEQKMVWEKYFKFFLNN